MTFKKTMLACALVALPVAGFSLESMDDQALSAVTGQDGVSISIETPAVGIGGDLLLHDLNGFTGAASAGAIVMTGFNIDPPSAITVLIDAGATAADGLGSEVLNIAVSIPANTVIQTGTISVAGSARDNASAWGVDALSSHVVFANTSITLNGVTTLNIQLGDELQNVAGTPGSATDMIAISTTITGGLSLTGVSLSDANSGGSVGISATGGQIDLIGNGASTDLGVGVAGNVTAAGLVLEVGTLGSATGMDVRMQRVYLGTDDAAHTLGDVEIRGLALAGTIVTITGKN